MRHNPSALLAAGAACLAVACTSSTPPPPADHGRFVNPYAGVDWSAASHYQANLHTHTTYSDGNYDPHQAIDIYHGLGYDILALTDHDTLHYQARPATLYPWTELRDIYLEIADAPHEHYNTTFAGRANEVWEDRDPAALGMLAVEGSELSGSDHVSSYFNPYAGGVRDVDTAFRIVGERGGLAMFNHPGRYNRDLEWYLDLFRRHPHVVGMEIYNQADRYPVDRENWDRILHRLMPDRPVWGFANDDTHGTEHFGNNRTIFLLRALTHENLRAALIDGHCYLHVPARRGDQPDIRITAIEHAGDRLRLHIDSTYNAIHWVTHDPVADQSHVCHTGPEIAVADLPAGATFVRAVILSDGGRTYTQPFGVLR
jgi:hypothetical protein